MSKLFLFPSVLCVAMFKEEDPLLSHPSVLPLEGVGLGPFGSSGVSDRALHLRGDMPMDERGFGFHLPPYPSDFSYSGQNYQEEYCGKSEGLEESLGGGGGGRGALSERQPSFESLELGFTELLPPLYPRGVPQPPSPSPWLDSPYLSSSPSPSHSSSLSPFPASSPISTSPLPPLPHSPYHPSCPYPQEVCPCPSPPANPGPSQDLYPPPPYSQFEGWESQSRVGTVRETTGGMKMQEGPLEFASSSSMHHITLEEGKVNDCASPLDCRNCFRMKCILGKLREVSYPLVGHRLYMSWCSVIK